MKTLIDIYCVGLWKDYFFGLVELTSGIMQVTSDVYLSNQDSVKKGACILIEKYNEVYKDKYHSLYTARRESIKYYNSDISYINEVESIYNLLEVIYPKSSDIYGCDGE